MAAHQKGMGWGERVTSPASPVSASVVMVPYAPLTPKSSTTTSTATSALLAGEPVVGFALVTLRTNVWFDGPVALLDELYVRPDLRDRGIGSAVVERLLADSVAAGVAMVEINVDEGDVDTLRFYERHGFTRTEPGSDERAFYVWREL